MQPLSYCQYGCYSHIYTTYVHTFVLIYCLEKWSLTFKILPGISPRLVLILLVLVCRIQHNDHKLMVTDISSTSHQSSICRDIYAVHPKNYENNNTTTQCTKLDCRYFGLSTFWSVDVLACRRYALSTFWFVNILVCRRFSLSMFQRVDVSVCRHFAGLATFRFVDVLTSYLQNGPLKHIKAWLVTEMVIILQTTYPNGFLQWNVSFKHVNPSFSPLMPRIKYRTCMVIWSRLHATGVPRKNLLM